MRTSVIVSLVALISVSACYSSAPGVIRSSAGNPLVVVGAGEIEVGAGAYYYARYVIDTRAQVCWFMAGQAASSMDCCALARIADARPYLSWLSPEICRARNGASPSAQAPAPPQAPMTGWAPPAQ